jgi:preprotein translocase subunit SecA
VYEQRLDIMEADALTDTVNDMRTETVNTLVGKACPPNSYPEQWKIESLKEDINRVFGLDFPIEAWVKEDTVDPEIVETRIREAVDAQVAEKRSAMGEDLAPRIEKSILLQAIDHHWKEHLATLDALRQVIGLRAYGQRNPLNEYKSEAFGLFERMLGQVREEVSRMMAALQLTAPPPPIEQLPDPTAGFITTHIDPFTGENDAAATPIPSDFGVLTRSPVALFGVTAATPLTAEQIDSATAVASQYGAGFDPADATTWLGKVSRNAPCPCGSGEKFKHCHGRN